MKHLHAARLFHTPHNKNVTPLWVELGLELCEPAPCLVVVIQLVARLHQRQCLVLSAVVLGRGEHGLDVVDLDDIWTATV